MASTIFNVVHIGALPAGAPGALGQEDFLACELLTWFKQKFFSWVRSGIRCKDWCLTQVPLCRLWLPFLAQPSCVHLYYKCRWTGRHAAPAPA